MLKFTDENGKLLVESEASMFIIPNRAGHISDFIITDSIKRDTEKYCEDNDIDFDYEKDWLVQVWMHSDDLGTDNFFRHGCIVDYEDEEFDPNAGDAENIPRQLIDVKEGEHFTLNFKDAIMSTSDRQFKVDLKLDVTAQQHGYRYERFGNFEEALNRVCVEG